MRRTAHTLVRFAAPALLALALTGCVSAETVGPRSATGVWGFVASESAARIELDQAGSTKRAVVAARVIAPADGFVVATTADANGGPDIQTGVAPVKRGENLGVKVPLDGMPSEVVTLTLYVDRGRLGTFEYDAMRPTDSWDRPVFVNGRPVTATITFPRDSVTDPSSTAVLDVFDQKLSPQLYVLHVRVSAPSWIVAYADQNGAPGALIAQASLAETDAIGFSIPFTQLPEKGPIWVGLNADTGAAGTFEYNRSAPDTSSPDQPYFVNGTEIIKRIVLQ